MKISGKRLEKDHSGTICLTPEDTDDIWQLYNLISSGDKVEALTERRVIMNESSSASSSADSTRMKLVLAVDVEKTEVDLVTPLLHVTGKNIRETKYVRLGCYHTLDLEAGKPVKITKDIWDTFALEQLQAAADVKQKAEIGAVLLHDHAANLFLITESITRPCQAIASGTTKKRIISQSAADKIAARFYDAVITAMLKHFTFANLKVVLVAGNGNGKDELLKRLFENAARDGNKSVLEARSKFVLSTCTSANKSALNDLINDPKLAARLADTKYAKELGLLATFHKILAMDDGRAVYGLDVVSRAAEECAIKVLLLSDGLLRSCDVKQRQRFAALVDTVKQYNGAVQIYSSGHATAEELAKLTGVAAILNYALPDE